jgi:uncharacterized protein YmfQ (DUF2313 family)
MDASAYLSQLIGLLPPGDALAREPGSVLARLLSVPAAELARVDGRVEALLTESDPARTTEMLPDWERALGLPDVCYPNFAFSRASTAWYFDGSGVLREAAVDEPRYSYDALGQRTEAVQVEAAGTNWVANSRLNGAAPGTPGVLPTGFAATVSGGLALTEIAFVGSEDGLPCIDLRITGTTAGIGVFALNFISSTAAPAANGEIWTGGWYWRLVAGSGPNVWQMGWQEYPAAGTPALADVLLAVTPPTGAALRGQRVTNTHTLACGATVAFVRHRLRLGVPAGTHDFTLRLAVPQLELGAVATSPILNPISGPAVTTRAADNLFIATVEERRARILARLIERFEPTPAAIIGLAARLGDTVTLTEFRPHDCAEDCEAPVLDDSWAHAFQVAGASQMVVEFTCQDTCETPLSQWRTGAYECAIRRFAPAQSVPIFSYV